MIRITNQQARLWGSEHSGHLLATRAAIDSARRLLQRSKPRCLLCSMFSSSPPCSLGAATGLPEMWCTTFKPEDGRIPDRSTAGITPHIVLWIPVELPEVQCTSLLIRLPSHLHLQSYCTILAARDSIFRGHCRP